MWLHGQLGLNEESILIDFDLWIRERINKIIYKIRISFLDLRSVVVDSNQTIGFHYSETPSLSDWTSGQSKNVKKESKLLPTLS